MRWRSIWSCVSGRAVGTSWQSKPVTERVPSGAKVRLLPTWEATLLVHARRTQILPERYPPAVFDTKTPHSVPTFLVDGQVAGTWRHEGGRVRLEPFEVLPRVVRRDLEDEAKRLAAFHAN
jgi:hypothetical protein